MGGLYIPSRPDISRGFCTNTIVIHILINTFPNNSLQRSHSSQVRARNQFFEYNVFYEIPNPIKKMHDWFKSDHLQMGVFCLVKELAPVQPGQPWSKDGQIISPETRESTRRSKKI